MIIDCYKSIFIGFGAWCPEYPIIEVIVGNPDNEVLQVRIEDERNRFDWRVHNAVLYVKKDKNIKFSPAVQMVVKWLAICFVFLYNNPKEFRETCHKLGFGVDYIVKDDDVLYMN